MIDFPSPAAGPPLISPLATTDAHAHPLATTCPVACLDGLLSPHALNPLLSHYMNEEEVATIADLAGLYRARKLGQVRGIGPGRIAEIEDLLLAAGQISSRECYVAAAATDLARRCRNWIAVIDGPVVRSLRNSHGFSQVLVARLAGISVSAVARAENEPASWCHRRTLSRLADVLGVPPGGLEHPAHQYWPAAEVLDDSRRPVAGS